VVGINHKHREQLCRLGLACIAADTVNGARLLKETLAGVVDPHGGVIHLRLDGRETAPLLFTAFNNQYWQTRVDQPIASLTVQLYNYAIAPYDDWHRQAWAAALVLMTITLILNIAARLVGRQRAGARR
jgi:phosphate transport system permease protein